MTKLETALTVRPDLARAPNHLGVALRSRVNLDEAISGHAWRAGVEGFDRPGDPRHGDGAA